MNTKIAYKAFNPDFTCLGFQYEVGKTYKQNGIGEVCASGFHSCEYPLDVLSYYRPVNLVLAEVSVSGDIKTHRQDSKLASSEITIIKQINFSELATAAVQYIAKNLSGESGIHMTADRSAASNNLCYSATTNTGDNSVASSTGSSSAACNTGRYSVAAIIGFNSAATATGTYSVATSIGDLSAATSIGYYSVATATGDNSAATNTGRYSASSIIGSDGVAVATGSQSKAKASKGSVIMLVYRDENNKIIHAKCEIIGTGSCKPDTYYTLSETGELVEC